MEDNKKKQVSASDLLSEQIQISEAVRLRCLKLIETTPLEERQAFQDALVKLDCSVQSLKQRYESSLRDQR